MSPDQCRAARERLGWTRGQLAAAAQVPEIIIWDYEDEGVLTIADAIQFVREALEEMGFGFPFEIEGGEARPAGVTFSPRDRGDCH